MHSIGKNCKKQRNYLYSTGTGQPGKSPIQDATRVEAQRRLVPAGHMAPEGLPGTLFDGLKVGTEGLVPRNVEKLGKKQP